MSLIPFPNVPVAPGVPQVPRQTGGILPSSVTVQNAALGALQSILWSVIQVQNQWGIFDSNGNALANPNSFVSTFDKIVNGAAGALGIGPNYSTVAVEYNKETHVPNFPVERGGFANYNKVELPAMPMVELAFDGSESERTTFLDAIEAACVSTNLYSVVTPEVTYLNYNVLRYDYSRRSFRGATLLVLRIALEEIRQVSVTFTEANANNINQPKNAAATPSDSGGNVQPQTPNPSLLRSIFDNIPQLIGSNLQELVQ